MQFRMQGKKIQCLRYEHDPEQNRKRQVMVATFPFNMFELPEDGLDDFSAAEVHKFDAWLTDRKNRLENEAALVFIDSFEAISQSIVRGVNIEDEMNVERSDVLWHGLAAIAKALRKADYPKPVAEKPAAKPHPGQADLLDNLSN